MSNLVRLDTLKDGDKFHLAEETFGCPPGTYTVEKKLQFTVVVLTAAWDSLILFPDTKVEVEDE